MPTLLLTPRQTDDTQTLWRACLTAGWRCERVHGWKAPDVPPVEAVPYGEALFAHHMAQTLGLVLIEPPIDWLPRLPEKFRQRAVLAMSLAEARSVRERVFIKSADAKAFAPGVYASGAELPPPGTQPDDFPVLVQEVVAWESEFRCFCCDGRVAALSVYARNGALAQADDGSWPATDAELSEAARLGETVLADPSVATPAAVVIDVGVIRGRGWAVVESNAAFASGIYGCEGVRVLEVLRRAVYCTSSLSSRQRDNR